jgi:hypothetical protein
MPGWLRSWLFCLVVALGAFALFAAACSNTSAASLTAAEGDDGDAPAPEEPEGDSDDLESGCEGLLPSAAAHLAHIALAPPRSTFGRAQEREPASHFTGPEPRPPSRA